MKKTKNLNILILFLLLFTSIANPQENKKDAIFTITGDELYRHVEFLASDEMKGRNTPSPELKKCADYIASEFESYGLIPGGNNGSYLQTFYLSKNYLDLTKTADGIPNKFSLVKKDSKVDYEIKTDFTPFESTGDGDVTASIVFVGYGITAPEYNYDDYENVNVQGKIVLIMTREPQGKDMNSVFMGKDFTKYAYDETKYKNAVEHGAAGVIIVRSPLYHVGKRPKNPWQTLTNPNSTNIPYNVVYGLSNDIPAIYIHTNIASHLLKGTGKDLTEVSKVIDEDLLPQSFEIEDKQVHIKTKLTREKTTTQNVVGYIEGSDPELRKGVIIIGGHYDHVGVMNGEVFNGANDNASGTAGVMELAEAFALSETKPKRSILFITFTGEEKGFFGSKYYLKNPVSPIENTVAMFNLDMIGRNDTNEIAIVGSKYNEDLNEILKIANMEIGLTLDYDFDNALGNSDHYPFMLEQIPALFFFSKGHPDLHTPGDDINKIIAEKMEKVTRLVFLTAMKIANTEIRPVAVPYN
ncbi:M28 family peptidase [Bacteroidota bacterium]